ENNKSDDKNNFDPGAKPTEKEPNKKQDHDDDGNLHEGDTKEETAVEADEKSILPELYENTVIYNGVLNPVFPWYIKFPGEDEGELLDVNDRHFSIVLASKDLKEGDEITIYIAGGEENENMVKTVSVQPGKDGKEI